MSKPPTLSSLAAQIWSHATILDAHFSREGQPRPSFDANAPSSWPAEKDTETSQAARHTLLELTLSLHDLVLGPPTHASPTLNLPRTPKQDENLASSSHFPPPRTTLAMAFYNSSNTHDCIWLPDQLARKTGSWHRNIPTASFQRFPSGLARFIVSLATVEFVLRLSIRASQ